MELEKHSSAAKNMRLSPNHLPKGRLAQCASEPTDTAEIKSINEQCMLISIAC